MKKRVLIIFILFQYTIYAQQDAWVYLSDKENVAFSIANPETMLSQRAIDRKNNHGIIIDERDVPVNETYITQLKSQAGITVLAKSKWFNAVHVRGSEVDINALSDLTYVAAIDFADKSLNTSGRSFSQNNKFEIEETLTDFVYGDTQNQVEMIAAHTLHLDDFTGEGMLIAVLDAGFPNVNTMPAFQRLRDNNDLLNGYDFVNRTEDVYAYTGNTHGTKVLSDMAGFIQDTFVGTAPDASYYVFRTEDAASENPVEESYWVEAAERADSLGVNIINSSLGYKSYDNPNYSYASEDLNGVTAFITKGANIANEKGILVVVSAGNSGASGLGAPADAEGALTIGAVDANGDYAAFSSQGSAFQPTQKPDVVARGASAFVIDETNTIVNNSGTSFSSPIMAGGVACLWQALPNATNNEIKQFVRLSASQYATPDYFLGYGIPNLGLALDLALSLQEEDFFTIKIFPNPVHNTLNVKIPSTVGQTNLLIFDVFGKQVLQKTITEIHTYIDTSEIASGLYMMLFQSEATSKTFKLIKS